MSLCGAQVLHSRSVEMAKRFGVRVHVRSTFGKETGTIVTSNEEVETADIRGIAGDLNAVLVSFKGNESSGGLAARVLEALEGSEISLRLVYTSSPAGDGESLALLISDEDRESAIQSLTANLGESGFILNESIAAVSVIGRGMAAAPGAVRKVLSSLSDLGIHPEIVSTSGITLTVVIGRDRAAEAIRKLHADLGLGEPIRSEERQSG
jgi:aspartate kinase